MNPYSEILDSSCQEGSLAGAVDLEPPSKKQRVEKDTDTPTANKDKDEGLGNKEGPTNKKICLDSSKVASDPRVVNVTESLSKLKSFICHPK